MPSRRDEVLHALPGMPPTSSRTDGLPAFREQAPSEFGCCDAGPDMRLPWQVPVAIVAVFSNICSPVVVHHLRSLFLAWVSRCARIVQTFEDLFTPRADRIVPIRGNQYPTLNEELSAVQLVNAAIHGLAQAPCPRA